jgi:Zn-dependent membrane protease YugP
MIRNRRSRRTVALLLMVAGGLLMLLSTDVGAGLLVFGLGVLLELVGLALEHRDRQ